MQDFDYIVGSVQGIRHVRENINNQDGFHIVENDSGITAVVTDGCSSGIYSEVGAKLGAQMAAITIASQLDTIPSPSPQVEDIELSLRSARVTLVREIGHMLGALDENFNVTSSNIAKYSLYTILGVHINRNWYVVFSLGDGYYNVDMRPNSIDPGPENAPDYISYWLLPGRKELHREFKVHETGCSCSVHQVLIGTDGVDDINKKSQTLLKNRRTQGTVEQFLTEDKFFKNKSLIQKRLRMMQINLGDDTTVIAIKRVDNAG